MGKKHSFALGAGATIFVLALASCAGQASFTPQEAVLSTPGTATITPFVQNSSEITLIPATASATPKSFIETFDGNPANPQPWRPTHWDVAVHSRDLETWDTLEPVHALHGSDCAAPPASHIVTSYDDAVFLCRDHLMTAINAGGYGAIYLTPNQQIDFSAGEAMISWDMSTMRTSGRDWVDLWITPFNDNLELPLEDWLPDLTGPPRNAVHIRMDLTNGDTMFRTSVVRDFNEIDLPDQNLSVGYESFLTPDAKRRDTFELRISRTHLQFGMPVYHFAWIDTDIPDLSWSQAVVQFGHHSYNPAKDAGCAITQTAATGCQPNTWHWDNISISPAAPFTLLRADRRTADSANEQIRFTAPAPADAHLRFAGIGSKLEVSFDNGATWLPAVEQAQGKTAEDHFGSYWTPVPQGTQAVQFRGSDWLGGQWLVRDISIWALDPTLDAAGGARSSR